MKRLFKINCINHLSYRKREIIDMYVNTDNVQTLFITKGKGNEGYKYFLKLTSSEIIEISATDYYDLIVYDARRNRY